MTIEYKTDTKTFVMSKKQPLSIEESIIKPKPVKPITIKSISDININKIIIPKPLKKTNIQSLLSVKPVSEMTIEELRENALRNEIRRKERKERMKFNKKERKQTETELREEAIEEWYQLNPDAEEGEINSDPYGMAYVDLYVKCHMDPMLQQWWNDPNYGLGISHEQWKYRREKFYNKIGYPEYTGIIPRVDMNIHILYFPKGKRITIQRWLMEFYNAFEGIVFFTRSPVNFIANNLEEILIEGEELKDYDLHICTLFNLQPESRDMLDFYLIIERLIVPHIGKYKQLLVITELPEDPDLNVPSLVEGRMWQFAKQHSEVILHKIYPHDVHLKWHIVNNIIKQNNYGKDELNIVIETIMEINPFIKQLEDDLRSIKYKPHKEKLLKILKENEEITSNLLNYTYGDPILPVNSLMDSLEDEWHIGEKLFDSQLEDK